MNRSRISLIMSAIATGMLCISSCGGIGSDNGCVTLDCSNVADGGTLAFSSLAYEPEFVALDSDTLAAFGSMVGAYLISDNYIVKDATSIVNTAEVKVFDRHTGKFVCNVGHIGRGPGEYLCSFQTFVDEPGGKVWIMDAPDHIKTYDIRTGKYLGDVPLAHEVMAEYGIASASYSVSPEDGTLTVFAVPYEEDPCPALAWCQDVEGNILWEIPETGRERRREPSNTLISSSFNVGGAFDVALSSGGSWPDTLYALDGNELSSVFTVDTRTLKDGQSVQSELLPGKVLSALIEQKEYMPGIYIGEYVARVLTDLKTGKSVRYALEFENDFLGVTSEWATFGNGWLILPVPAVDFLEIGRNALDKGLLSGDAAAQVEAILSDLRDTDNDILMLARLKR